MMKRKMRRKKKKKNEENEKEKERERGVEGWMESRAVVQKHQSRHERAL